MLRSYATLKRTPLKRTAALKAGTAKLKPKGKRGKRYAFEDKWFSDAVKSNAKGICERCGRAGEHAHHVAGRKSKLLRFDLRNGVYLCALCHGFAHQHKPEFEVWFATYRPSDYNFIDENRFRSTKEVA